MRNNFEKLLQQASEHHKNGRLKNAEMLYREILVNQPHHPDANHNLGVLNVTEGNLLVAIQLFKKAVDVNPRYEQFWHSYIYTIVKSGQIEDAYKFLIEADKIGISSERLGLLKKKIIYIIQRNKNKKNSQPQQFQIDNLQKSFQKKNFADTEKIAKIIIQECPNHPYAWNILAASLEELGRREEAILNYQKAASLSPEDSTIYDKMGILLTKQGRPKEALENFKKIILIKPNNAAAYNNIGVSLQTLGQKNEAIKYFKKATEINPKHVEGFNNLGNLFKELGKFKESSHYFKKAVDIKPDYADGYQNWGRALMLNNDFEQAFKLMEWRLHLDEKNFIPLNTSKPRWDGRTQDRVFVWKEQGIGDHIMFSSMISELHANVEKVIVECDPRLLPLFQRSFSHEISFITDRAEISEDDYDSHLPIGSLPLHFRKELSDFKKSSKGWLKADPQKVQNIRQNINYNNQKKIIGVSWNTLSLLSHSKLRNIDLVTFLEPLKNLDLIFVNLQYGEVLKQIISVKSELDIEFLEISNLDLFNDLDGLSALISLCDNIISIDNFTVHLAGALGAKTALLLPKVADERWGLAPSKSYIYDSLVLYRQIIHNSWREPLKKMKIDIQNSYH